MKKYKPQTKEELEKLVYADGIKLYDVDTSLITDMSELFYKSSRKDFEGIEDWDVSNVEDMFRMFDNCKKFNQPLNSWNVSNVTNMSGMFQVAESFNQPLDKWNTKKLSKMYSMFKYTYNYDCYDSLANWDLSKVSDMSDLCSNYEKVYEKLPLRLKAYMQAFYGSHNTYVAMKDGDDEEDYDLVSRDYITITKENVKEVYNAISKDTNKKVVALKKRLESEFSEELSSVTDNYNFKTIKEAEKYVEDNYNKKDDKKVSFINDCKVLIKDKSREVENKVLKYIYLEYLLLKRDVKRLTQIDNIVNFLDKESFIEFIKNIYDKTNKETAAFIYGIYGGDDALYNIYKKEQDTKLSLLIIKLNSESKYALRLLYKIYTSTKKSEVRYEADKLIDEVMKKMDIDYNEFQLRFSSNLLFNSEGEMLLNKDYKLILNSDYSLSLFDIKNNKELKKIPQNFDEKLKEEIKSLRKEITGFIKNTSHLLSVLLIEGRIYSYDFYKDVFVDNE